MQHRRSINVTSIMHLIYHVPLQAIHSLIVQNIKSFLSSYFSNIHYADFEFACVVQLNSRIVSACLMKKEQDGWSLHNICTNFDFRRKGIGTMLLEYVCKEFKSPLELNIDGQFMRENLENFFSKRGFHVQKKTNLTTTMHML